MRLTAAFFANRADVVDGMLNVDGGFWSSTTVPPRAAGFACYAVVLCDVDAADIGRRRSLRIDAAGPSGRRWTAAQSTDFTVDGVIRFMRLPQMTLPIEPDGGRHVYSFRLDGQHERVDLELDVRVAWP